VANNIAETMGTGNTTTRTGSDNSDTFIISSIVQTITTTRLPVKALVSFDDEVRCANVLRTRN